MSMARLRRGLYRSTALAPAGGGGGGIATFLATANPAWQNIAYGANSATFSAAATGTAAGDRISVVGIAMDGTANKPVTAVTINGVSATKACETNTAVSRQCSLWYAANPSGTTGDVVISCPGFGIGYIAIAVGMINGATATPTNTGVVGSSYTGSPGVASLTVPSSGVGVVVAMSYGPPADIGNWTNATQDYETMNSTSHALGFAHTTSTGSLSPTIAGSGDNELAMAAAAWGP